MSEYFQEITKEELVQLVERSGESPFAVYFHTPLCGSCAYGEKMLIVVQVMEPGAKIYKCNANFMPDLVQEWKVESVPCLAYVKGRQVKEKVYPMRSVEFLLEKVRGWLT